MDTIVYGYDKAQQNTPIVGSIQDVESVSITIVEDSSEKDVAPPIRL